MIRSVFKGSGSALPAKCMTNDELAELVDTSDEWIRERTGITCRHIAGEGETTATLATAAARAALADAGIAAAEIDLIVLATATPDSTFPATATKVQDALGCNGGIAFDVAAVCSGFLYALATADSMLRTGMAKCALVIGAETFSRILDWEDRATCVLFGDGAGRVRAARRGRRRGRAGRARHPAPRRRRAPRPALCRRRPLDHRHGRQAADEGPRGVPPRGRQPRRKCSKKCSRRPVIPAAEIDWVVPHQANLRILDATARKLGLPFEKVVVTVDRHANTSAASVPLAFDVARRDGRIKAGDLVMLEAMGGGFTWGASLLRV